MFAHGSVSLHLFPMVWIFLKSLGVICCDRLVLSGGHKNYFKDFCLMNSQSTFLLCKPDHFELHNSIKFSFTSIWGLCLNFLDCKSFLESNSPDILALCETNLDGSRGYFPLIQKDSSTHMHGLGCNSADSYLCFGLALLQSVSYFIFLCRSPSLSLCTVFDSISSNIDEVLSINPSANVFVFEDINVQHKD